MPTAYVVHIAAGGLALASGFVALYSSKGAPRHRRAGMVFVYAMLTMCAFGTLIAAVRGVAPALNIPSALLTAGLVATGMTTVRPRSTMTEWIDRAAMALLCATAAAAPVLAAAGFASGSRVRIA